MATRKRKRARRAAGPKGRIDLDLPPKAEFLRTTASRYKVLHGGRGGGKSWSMARALLERGAKRPIRVLCAREHQASIRDSVHRLLADQIAVLGLRPYYRITADSIRGVNGTAFVFAGLRHNVDNIRSKEGIDICWVEEAQAVSRHSWETLIPTIRKDGSEIWVTFNPMLEEDDTWQRFVVRTPAAATVEKIGLDDNKHCPQVLRDEAAELKARDPQAWAHVWGGECRRALEGAVYAAELARAREEGRLGAVPYEPSAPVHCFWDLGWADSVTVWMAQAVGLEFRVIDYLSGAQKPIDWYVSELSKRSYVWGEDWLPPGPDPGGGRAHHRGPAARAGPPGARGRAGGGGRRHQRRARRLRPLLVRPGALRRRPACAAPLPLRGRRGRPPVGPPVARLVQPRRRRLPLPGGQPAGAAAEAGGGAGSAGDGVDGVGAGSSEPLTTTDFDPRAGIPPSRLSAWRTLKMRNPFTPGTPEWVAFDLVQNGADVGGMGRRMATSLGLGGRPQPQLQPTRTRQGGLPGMSPAPQRARAAPRPQPSGGVGARGDSRGRPPQAPVQRSPLPVPPRQRPDAPDPRPTWPYAAPATESERRYGEQMLAAGKLRFAPGIRADELSRGSRAVGDRDNYFALADGTYLYDPRRGDAMRRRRDQAARDVGTIHPSPGMPEDGKSFWRTGNDESIEAAVAEFNRANNAFPGDPLYWTNDRLKAQMMIESGGSPEAFRTDPMQVNVDGDYAPEKLRVLGLTRGQAMTPSVSIPAALDWLRYKAEIRRRQGQSYDPRGALYGYNGAKYHKPDSAREHRDWYADEVLDRERRARGVR